MADLSVTLSEIELKIRKLIALKNQIEENGTEKQFIKQFDTFMNKAILDYVEEEDVGHS